MDCYIVNLDRAESRWETVSDRFRRLDFNVIRLPAIDARELRFPHPDVAAWKYFLCYGRRSIPGKIACYLSHLKALATFLESGAEHAMICEDDVTPQPELPQVLEEAMRYRGHWDLLRLNGIKPTRGYDFAQLPCGYRLGCDLKTASGNGAKVVNRLAAERIVTKLKPIFTPHDVALFYSWPIGIRELSVRPFPILLNDHFAQASTIEKQDAQKYPAIPPYVFRFFTVLPYRVLSRGTRKLSRISWALRCRVCPPQPCEREISSQAERNPDHL